MFSAVKKFTAGRLEIITFRSPLSSPAMAYLVEESPSRARPRCGGFSDSFDLDTTPPPPWFTTVSCLTKRVVCLSHFSGGYCSSVSERFRAILKRKPKKGKFL